MCKFLSSIIVVLLCVSFQVESQPNDTTLEPREEQEKRRKRLVNAFNEGPVSGRIFSRIPGRFTFAPEFHYFPIIEIFSVNKISEISVGPQVQIVGHVDEDNFYLIIDQIKPGINIESFVKNIKSPMTAESLIGPQTAEGEAIRKTTEEIARNIELALRTDALGPVNDNDARKNFEDYKRYFENGDDVGRRDTVVAWRSLRESFGDSSLESSSFKSVYGKTEDYYKTETFEDIVYFSKGVVAIGRQNECKPRCTGFHVGGNIIITAAHCFSESADGDRLSLSELEVMFGLRDSANECEYAAAPNTPAEANSEKSLTRKVESQSLMPNDNGWGDVIAGNFGDGGVLDYVALQLTHEAPQHFAEASFCLAKSETAALRRDPVFMVGYPELAPQRIHANGVIEFPHILSRTAYLKIRRDLEADFIGLPDEYTDVLAKFDLSYQPLPKGCELNKCSYHNFDERANFQPSIGIEMDAFRGNSGSPVMKMSVPNLVVGVLTQGAPDIGQRRRVSWKVHERILPAHSIYQNMVANSQALKALTEDGTICVR